MVSVNLFSTLYLSMIKVTMPTEAGDIYMQYDKIKMTAKAQKWLENATDEEDIGDVNQLLGRIETMDESPRLQRRLETLNTYIKGTSMRVTLNEAQMATKVRIVDSLNQIFTLYPDLSIPRTRNLETLGEKVEEAIKAQIKAESK